MRQAALPFPDNLFRLADDADPTRLAAFDLSGLSTGTTRTFTLPDARITTESWHEFLDDFVHDAELVARIKAQSPR